LTEKIIIPTEQPHLQCLGPLGNPDPTDLINAETNRIPFRAKNFSLDLLKDTFRSWPSSTKGWKDWFLRVSNTNEVQWGERKLDQCIRLSIADMDRNESLLIAASNFWSDTLNAFLFGHLFDRKAERKVETRNIGAGQGISRSTREWDQLGKENTPIF